MLSERLLCGCRGLFLGIEDRGTPQIGSIWFDDIRVEEVALLNVVRREGAPVTLRIEKTGAVLTERVDYRYTYHPPAATLRPTFSIHGSNSLCRYWTTATSRIPSGRTGRSSQVTIRTCIRCQLSKLSLEGS